MFITLDFRRGPAISQPLYATLTAICKRCRKFALCKKAGAFFAAHSAASVCIRAPFCAPANEYVYRCDGRFLIPESTSLRCFCPYAAKCLRLPGRGGPGGGLRFFWRFCPTGGGGRFRGRGIATDCKGRFYGGGYGFAPRRPSSRRNVAAGKFLCAFIYAQSFLFFLSSAALRFSSAACFLASAAFLFSSSFA